MINSANSKEIRISEASMSPDGKYLLTSVMDFGQWVPTGTQLSIVTRCVFPNGQAVNIQPTQMRRPLQTTIPVHQMMPREAFFYAPFDNFRSFDSGMPISCSFDFTALGPDGRSTHHFDFMVQNYYDTGAALNSLLRRNTDVLDLQWTSNPTSPANKQWRIPVISENDLPQVDLNIVADQAELRCRGFDPEVVSVGQNFLSLKKFLWNEDKPEKRNQRLVRQLCRIIGFNPSGVSAISPYFYFDANPPPVSVTLIPHPVANIAAFEGSSFEFQTAVVTNRSPMTIHLRLPANPIVNAYILDNGLMTMHPRTLLPRIFADGVLSGSSISLPPDAAVAIHEVVDLNFRCDSADHPAFGAGIALPADGQNFWAAVTDSEGSTFENVSIFGANDIVLPDAYIHTLKRNSISSWRQRPIDSTPNCR